MSTYIAIDLKSFYASVECVDRGLDPLNTNLVVADKSRTEKTICLAVTPSLKAFGISGRARLFEVVQQVKLVNRERQSRAYRGQLTGKSCLGSELSGDSSLEVDYIVAPPRMAHYMEVSTKIVGIYLKYVAPEDLHVYSIDEVFIDVTGYLKTYRCTAHDLAMRMIRDVLRETGITATAGVGTNLYLAKIAMDIVAKKMKPDKDGVRIAELDEMSYREKLWEHTPLTDFWRVGSGMAKRLAGKQMYTMGDIAKRSLSDEEQLYSLFGVNAELLIDHAWGWEPCTISDIKAYRPENKSLSSGQVLQCPYSFTKARLIIREMTELLVLDLVEKGIVTDQMVLTVGYDTEGIPDFYDGVIETDRYGRKIPKSVHGSVNLGGYTSSTIKIREAVTKLYESLVDRSLQIRRMTIAANHILPECEAPVEDTFQLDLFTDYETAEKERRQEEKRLSRERSIQSTMVSLKQRFGKNAIIKGMNLEEGATAMERNRQVGGHRA